MQSCVPWSCQGPLISQKCRLLPGSVCFGVICLWDSRHEHGRHRLGVSDMLHLIVMGFAEAQSLETYYKHIKHIMDGNFSFRTGNLLLGWEVFIFNLSLQNSMQYSLQCRTFTRTHPPTTSFPACSCTNHPYWTHVLLCSRSTFGISLLFGFADL